ncbi:MAG TPA: glycosyltransferase [Thermoanaerobaculia bacterium]|jgi:glycosyltransferase involved in cell wall biosynthesis|nr:glycosyltransferase [Thermoanaerobaculia bacterium]
MISIVIPTLNEERYLPTLLRSLSVQELTEALEIIVADNHSTDRTREVALAHSGLFPLGIRIVSGGRPAAGRNHGARASTGDPVFFLDADIELRDRNLLTQCTALFRRRHLAAASVRLEPASELWRDHVMVGFYNALLWSTHRIAPLGAMFIAASRYAFEASGGFPEDVAICEDHDFVGRCAAVGPYGVLPGRASFNVRRFRYEGRLKLCLKYIHATYLRVAFGPVKQFDYDFACFDPEITQSRVHLPSTCSFESERAIDQ